MKKKSLKNEMYGEDEGIDLLSNKLSNITNSEIDELFTKYDLFDLTIKDEILAYARDMIIKKYSKKNLDYRTELPN